MSSTPQLATSSPDVLAALPTSGSTEESRFRAAVHGLALEVECDLPAIRPELRRLLSGFAVPDWPDGFAPIRGSVHPFSLEAVRRSLSATAVNISPADELIELYRDGDRFWVIDDRWGMAELNLLKRQWRSWVLPRPQVDEQRQFEMAILWPLAQLMRLRGLSLVPAVSVVHGGWAALILCPFGIEPELRVLLQNDYRLIGQRWTALREEEGRVALLHLPGRVERVTAPARRESGPVPARTLVDLGTEFPGGSLNHAFCDAVLLVIPGRRTAAATRPILPTQVPALLRRSWPMVDLPVGSRGTTLSNKLASTCAVHELQLSRNAADLLRQIETLRTGSNARPAAAR